MNTILRVLFQGRSGRTKFPVPPRFFSEPPDRPWSEPRPWGSKITHWESEIGYQNRDPSRAEIAEYMRRNSREGLPKSHIPGSLCTENLLTGELSDFRFGYRVGFKAQLTGETGNLARYKRVHRWAEELARKIIDNLRSGSLNWTLTESLPELGTMKVALVETNML